MSSRSSGSSGSGPQATSITLPDAGISAALGPNESCSLAFDPVTKSTTQRSCRSCLAKSVCAIHPTGQCIDKSEPSIQDGGVDFLPVFLLPNGSVSDPAQRCAYLWESFSSPEYSYCSVEDAVCMRCIEKSFDMEGYSPDSRFCVGASGCVCIFACEFPYGGELHGSCEPPLSTEAPSGQPPMQIILAIMAHVLLLGVLVGVYVWRRKRDERLAREERRRRRRELRDLRLAQREQRREEFFAGVGAGSMGLDGWKKYREGLIETEQHQLSLTTTEAPYVEAKDAPSLDTSAVHSPDAP